MEFEAKRRAWNDGELWPYFKGEGGEIADDTVVTLKRQSIGIFLFCLRLVLKKFVETGVQDSLRLSF